MGFAHRQLLTYADRLPEPESCRPMARSSHVVGREGLEPKAFAATKSGQPARRGAGTERTFGRQAASASDLGAEVGEHCSGTAMRVVVGAKIVVV